MSTEDKVLESPNAEQQLIEAVRKQIEYYFSKENLQTDVFLKSQMDGQMSVPLNVVMKFAKLKALTQDEAVVRKSLEQSTLTIIDNRIKANIKASGRSTIILREIPSDAPEEEVKEIFNYEGCKSINSIRSDIGDTWFVVMETEEDAKDTTLDLRLKKRTFRGLPVKARIKTEPVGRSFYSVPTVAVPPVYSINPMMPFAPIVPNPLGMDMYGFIPSSIPEAPSAVNSAEASTEVIDNTEGTETAEESEGKFDESADSQYGASKQAIGRPRDVRRVARPSTGREGDVRKRGDRRTVDRVGKEKTERRADGPVAKPPIEVNAMTFPPLHGSEETPVPTPGYKDTYIKLSFEEIIGIVKNVKEANLPSEVKAEDHSVALTTTPNMDLLKRQRTFSIDETREQLRQGRPVQREAIISGAVDYRSLMYGDDSHPSQAAKEQAPVSSSGAVDAASSSSSAEQTENITVDALKELVAPETVEKNVLPSTEHIPVSPTKISTSTWAAMVKSSAAATQPEVITTSINNNNNNVNKSATKAKPSNNNNSVSEKPVEQAKTEKSSEQSSGKGKNKVNDNKDKNNEKKSNQKSQKDDRKKEKKVVDSENHQDSTVVVSSGENLKTVENNLEKLSVDDASNNGEAAATVSSTTTAPAAGWGGKASFANVLKQKLAEDGTEEKPASDNLSSNDKSKNSRNKGNNNDQRFKSNNNNSNNSSTTGSTNFRTGSKAKTTTTESKKPSPANADGMWVKETLPALPAEK